MTTELDNMGTYGGVVLVPGLLGLMLFLVR